MLKVTTRCHGFIRWKKISLNLLAKMSSSPCRVQKHDHNLVLDHVVVVDQQQQQHYNNRNNNQQHQQSDHDHNMSIKKSPHEVTILAEKHLGPDRFSYRASLTGNFGRFQEIIKLFLFQISNIDHPLLQITKIIEAEQKFLYQDETCVNPFPCWRSMVVLLCTEMFGYSDQIKASPKDVYNCMIDRHNKVASIAEVSYISQILHTKVLDVKDCLSAVPFKRITEENKYLDEMHSGNKAAILIGDSLLSRKCVLMAALRSPIATDIVCTTLSDYCEGTFELDLNSNWFDNYRSQELYTPWLKRTQLGQGTVLGNMIYLNLHFSGRDSQIRNKGLKIGQLIGTMLQAHSDIEFFENHEKLENPSWLNLSLLPVVIKVSKNPSILNNEHSIIFQKVKEDKEVMELARELFHQYQKESLKYLSELSQNEIKNITARDLLCEFLRSFNH